MIELVRKPENIAFALAVLNFITFAAFGFDKVRAENNMRRTPESMLLQLAFFGGIIGAYVGRAVFRHKTRKQPFSNQLHLIALAQLCATVFAVIYFW